MSQHTAQMRPDRAPRRVRVGRLICALLLAGIAVGLIGYAVPAGARAAGWAGRPGSFRVGSCRTVDTGRSSHWSCPGRFTPAGHTSGRLWAHTADGNYHRIGVDLRVSLNPAGRAVTIIGPAEALQPAGALLIGITAAVLATAFAVAVRPGYGHIPLIGAPRPPRWQAASGRLPTIGLVAVPALGMLLVTVGVAATP